MIFEISANFQMSIYQLLRSLLGKGSSPQILNYQPPKGGNRTHNNATRSSPSPYYKPTSK